MNRETPSQPDRQIEADSSRRHIASGVYEFNLRELVSVLWARKWVISGVTMVFAAASVFWALAIPNQYTATAVLASASGGNVNGLSSQLSGLASLAGVNLGDGDGDESQIALEVMQSWDFVDKFIGQNNLQVEVFAARGWDRTSDKLLLDGKVYDAHAAKWVRKPRNGKTIEPTSWELFDGFSKRLTVSQDKKTGLISVSVEYFSPNIAKQWVDKLVDAINDHMRLRKLDASNRNIDYLQAQIDKTSIAEMKEVFYQLIEDQTKDKMLAEASPEYQFVTVSPAMVPEEKSKPRRSVIVLLATMLGGMAAAFFVLVSKTYAGASISNSR